MLQRLLDIRPKVTCESVHGALTEILQELLVNGYPAIELVSKSVASAIDDPQIIFDRVRTILIEAFLLDADTPVSHTSSGIRRVRIGNPHYSALNLRSRIRLSE